MQHADSDPHWPGSAGDDSFNNFFGQSPESSWDESLQIPGLESLPLSRLQPELLSEFVKQIPKCELHCHLEGFLDAGEIFQLAQRHAIPLPANTPEGIRTLFEADDECQSLAEFLQIVDRIGDLFINTAVVRDMAERAVHVAALENIHLLELRFSPFYIARAHQLDLEEVTRAVLTGMSRGTADTGVITTATVIVERQMGEKAAWEIERLAEKYRGEGVVALDLANDEANFPPAPYTQVFQAAKRAGLGVTIHAGEAGGADNVRDSIELLGATRIGHGVRTIEDPAVVKLVRDSGVFLEMCPTSNVQLKATEDLSHHPIRQFFDQDIPVTINTDDPGMFGIRLSDEYLAVLREFHFTLPELQQLIQNSVDAAFLEHPQRQELELKMSEEFRSSVEWLHQQTSLSGK